MDAKEMMELVEKFLEAWNSQDVETVLNCYTEDCVYRDPNTRGEIHGHEAFRRYLTKLFVPWKMHWALREPFLFEGGGGGAFLWRARIAPARGGEAVEIDGMDLVLVRDGRISRNDVNFDRVKLLEAMK
ncbi:MAG: nuclear transport factor 2 family protein [Thermodesulfobacteriota bacterium]